MIIIKDGALVGCNLCSNHRCTGYIWGLCQTFELQHAGHYRKKSLSPRVHGLVGHTKRKTVLPQNLQLDPPPFPPPVPRFYFNHPLRKLDESSGPPSVVESSKQCNEALVSQKGRVFGGGAEDRESPCRLFSSDFAKENAEAQEREFDFVFRHGTVVLRVDEDDFGRIIPVVSRC